MLEVSRTSTLAMIIVCRNCSHTESPEAPAVWVDDNGDVYYDGRDKESLVAFVFHHG